MPINDPIGWWKLDDGSGSTAVDSSGNGLNATLVNTPAWINGKIGSKALSFTAASSQHLTLPTGFANFTNGLTMAVWAYPTISGTWTRFLDLGNGSFSDNIIFGRYHTSNDLFYEVYNANATLGGITATDGIINNEWHHYAVTEDSSANVTLYRDGSSIATGTQYVPLNLSRASNFVGRSNFAGESYYDGLLDDIRIYNRALSSGEILSLYQYVSGADVAWLRV